MVKLIVKDAQPIEDKAEKIHATFSPELPSKVGATLSAMGVPPSVVWKPWVFQAIRAHDHHADGGGETSQMVGEPTRIHEAVVVRPVNHDPLATIRHVGPA